MRRWILAIIVLAGQSAWADKGHIWPRPVGLSEASQKAIIRHNRNEEVLILGVELQARVATEILDSSPPPPSPR